jgi:hypothetical protein
VTALSLHQLRLVDAKQMLAEVRLAFHEEFPLHIEYDL